MSNMMFRQDPRMNPETANIVQHSSEQPFAERSVRTVFGLVIALFLVGAFFGWFFFGGSPENVDAPREEQSAQMQANPYSLPEGQEQVPENAYEEGSGRSGVYNFFYQMFGGIDDGLEDHPLNLENLSHVDDLNIDTNRLFHKDEAPALATGPGSSSETRQLERESQTKGNHFVNDVIGSDVFDSKGLNAGTVFDIIVNKQTGDGRAIIVSNDEERRYERSLSAISFKRVARQQEDGDTMVTVTEEIIEASPDFSYSSLNDNNFISLRLLNDGEVLDFEGNVAGDIETVIYDQDQVQSIFFKVLSQFVKTDMDMFQIAFKDADLVRGDEGYDIRLSKEQTFKLAEMLSSSEGQK